MNTPAGASEIFRTLSQANLVQVGLILIGAWLLIFVSARFLPWIANRVSGRFRFYLLAFVPVLRLAIILATGVLTINRIINPTIENFMVLLGALGLGLGFAMKEYVSSLIAGVVTLYEAPYRPGDWITINGAYGEVKSISMRSAEIVTPDDTVVVIPHMKLWDQLIFNANDGGEHLQCAADFFLHPRHDAAKVTHLLHDVALTSAFLQLTQPIHVIVTEKPWGTHYRLKAYPLDLRQQFHFVSDLTIRGKAVLTKAGMNFATLPVTSEGRL